MIPFSLLRAHPGNSIHKIEARKQFPAQGMSFRRAYFFRARRGKNTFKIVFKFALRRENNIAVQKWLQRGREYSGKSIAGHIRQAADHFVKNISRTNAAFSPLRSDNTALFFHFFRKIGRCVNGATEDAPYT